MLWLVLTVLYITNTVVAVKSHLFRNCDQNPFCLRNREYAEAVDNFQRTDDYRIAPESIHTRQDAVEMVLVKNVCENSEDQGEQTVLKLEECLVELPLTVSFVATGGIHMEIDEKKRQAGEIEIMGSDQIRKERYSVREWIYPALNSSVAQDDIKVDLDESKSITITKVSTKESIKLSFKPFKAEFSKDSQVYAQFNEAGYLNYEEWQPIESSRSEARHKAWEDTFDGHTDKKSRGAESVAADIVFPGFTNLYGIPEHADSLLLKSTRGEGAIHSEPYRLFNVDIFEYETDSPMPMYGSIPYMHAHRPGHSVGVFWANAADTYVDIDANESRGRKTHWMSETGVLDLFVFMGQAPSDVLSQYGHVTGMASLPQTFAIGYHQCRWNYNSQEDVREVSAEFSAHHLPMDVMWLDVEYSQERKYFEWNSQFPDPQGMMEDLDEHGKRKLVAIIDPHTKAEKSYKPYKYMADHGLVVQNADNKDYHGHCWPGESVWVDMLNPKAREYWTELLRKDENAPFTDAENLHIWNDMNEPSVFDGVETTMPKSNIHYGGWEHRDLHNLWGLPFHSATVDSMKVRYNKSDQRPFVLSRSYFTGTQKVGAVWTGDNRAQWRFLKAGTPMILTSGIAGLPFNGADVGGFFGDPTPELLTRWYQAGAFYPFFRAHAHIESKRREPYLLDTPETEAYYTAIKQALRLRYKLLPTWYTAFYHASVDLSPVVRPMFFEFPDDKESASIEDQFFLGGSGIIVKPVVDEGVSSVDVYFPDSEVYYDYETHRPHKSKGLKSVDTPLDKIPMFMRGGYIHFRRDRPRRSSELMVNDPYTIVVAVSIGHTAKGDIYIDDGITHAYRDKDEYTHMDLTWTNGVLKSNRVHGTGEASFDQNVVEKIEIIAPTGRFTAALIQQDGETWQASVYPCANGVTVRNPRVKIGRPFTLTLN